MFERKSYPYGVPCWVDTIQPDVEAAVAFYSGLFGWECEDQMPPDAGGHYYSAKLHGLEVAAIGGPAAAPKGMWQSYVAVESADDAARRVEKAGGRIVTEPTDAMDAGRYATFADLAGAEFSVWQARRHIGAQLCNEPGSGTSASSTLAIRSKRPSSTATSSIGKSKTSRWATATSRSSSSRATASGSWRTTPT